MIPLQIPADVMPLADPRLATVAFTLGMLLLVLVNAYYVINKKRRPHVDAPTPEAESHEVEPAVAAIAYHDAEPWPAYPLDESQRSLIKEQR